MSRFDTYYRNRSICNDERCIVLELSADADVEDLINFYRISAKEALSADLYDDAFEYLSVAYKLEHRLYEMKEDDAKQEDASNEL